MEILVRPVFASRIVRGRLVQMAQGFLPISRFRCDPIRPNRQGDDASNQAEYQTFFSFLSAFAETICFSALRFMANLSQK
jgi:hypothetical protein